jgi:hypothetical protein
MKKVTRKRTKSYKKKNQKIIRKTDPNKIIFGILITCILVFAGYILFIKEMENGDSKTNEIKVNNKVTKSNIDLYPIDIVFPNNQPGEGKEVTINSTIKCCSNCEVNNIIVRFSGGCGQSSMLLGEDIISSIGANESRVASITISDCSMAVIYSVEVDPRNKIQESIENNNIIDIDIREMR